MPNRFLIHALGWAALLVAVPASADAPAHDLPGSHDSPLVSRFAGSTIIGYHASEYDQAVLPMGRFANGEFAKTRTVSGKVTSIAYAAPVGKSALEVFRNYQAALANAGFVTQFRCDDSACGSMEEVSSAVASENVTQAMSTPDDDVMYGQSMIETLSCIDGSFHLLTAHLSRPQGNVDLSLMICGNPGKQVGVLLRTVEAKPMAGGEVTVNADAMSKGLAQHGLSRCMAFTSPPTAPAWRPPPAPRWRKWRVF